MMMSPSPLTFADNLRGRCTPLTLELSDDANRLIVTGVCAANSGLDFLLSFRGNHYFIISLSVVFFVFGMVVRKPTAFRAGLVCGRRRLFAAPGLLRKTICSIREQTQRLQQRVRIRAFLLNKV